MIIIGVLAHVADYEQAKEPCGPCWMRSLGQLRPSATEHTATSQHRGAGDYNESGAVAYNLRSKEEIAGFFEGLEVVDPG